mgnify:FL=1
MFIEQATRLARELSTSKNRGENLKGCKRNHSESFKNKSTDFKE